ncbi:MAG: hypothetical protein L6V85_06215 [Clostridiales bacterium]|nr:MAG: hypothetical protein L6V85_06215 [Clostridiales bacterium]
MKKEKHKNKFAENKRFSMWKNLLLPRRERLFNNGGKLHFQNFSALFFKVFYQRLSHRQISLQRNITAVGSSRHRRIASARGKNIVSSLLQCIPCSDPRNDIVLRTQNNICSDYPPPLKSQNFDAIKPHKYTVSCGGPVTFLGKFLQRGENYIIKYKS